MFLFVVSLLVPQVCFSGDEEEGCFLTCFYDETSQVEVQAESSSDNGYWVSCVVWTDKEKLYLPPRKGIYNQYLTFNLPAGVEKITIGMWQKVYKTGTGPGPDPYNRYAQNPSRTYYFWGELHRDDFKRKCKENWRTKKMECWWDEQLGILDKR